MKNVYIQMPTFGNIPQINLIKKFLHIFRSNGKQLFINLKGSITNRSVSERLIMVNLTIVVCFPASSLIGARIHDARNDRSREKDRVESENTLGF